MARKRILLVDDSATTLMWQKMILRREDYELIEARDGAEGVEKALASEPDLILMDVVMPRMNGFEAVKRLRADRKTQAVPIIMVTTRSEEHNITTGFESGCNDYVTKPIDSVELIAKVKTLLEAE